MKKIEIILLSCLVLFAFAFFLYGEKSVIGEKINIPKDIKLIEGEIIINRISFDKPGTRSHSIFPSNVEFEEDGVKKIMFLWSEEDGVKNIYYSVKENNPNAPWSTPAKASFTNEDSKTPNMVVDPKKPTIVHLVWADGETRAVKDIYHSRYFDKAWHGKTNLIHHPYNESFPSVSILDDGTIVAAWEYMLPDPVTKLYDNNNAFYRCNDTWTINEEQTVWHEEGHTMTTNTKYESTHIDIASRGLRTYAVWQYKATEINMKVIMFAEKIQKEGVDDHWTWPIRISSNEHSSWPQITVDSHNNLHVIWSKTKGGKYGYNCRIYGEWQGPSEVNHGNSKREFADIKVDKDDMLHAVFRGDLKDIYYTAKSANDLGEWPEEEKVTNGRDCSHASINVTDSTEYAHLSFSDLPPDSSSTKDVYYATFKRYKDTTTVFPEADFTVSVSNETAIIGMPVTFDATPSQSSGGLISSYYWDFGDIYDDNNYPEEMIVTHTFEAEGEHKVTLSILDKSRGLIGNKSVTINVIRGPMPPLNVVSSTFLNRAFLYREWINNIEWEANPQNTELGFTIENYKIYRRITGSGDSWNEIAVVVPTPKYYYDKGFVRQEDALSYEYGVSVVADGMESDIASTSTIN